MLGRARRESTSEVLRIRTGKVKSSGYGDLTVQGCLVGSSECEWPRAGEGVRAGRGSFVANVGARQRMGLVVFEPCYVYVKSPRVICPWGEFDAG
jgi:hypothetical protein